MEITVDFDSFWDLATPEEVAGMIAELYGGGAVEAAEQCVASASSDQRDDDYRFWTAVLARVVAADRRRQGAVLQ